MKTLLFGFLAAFISMGYVLAPAPTQAATPPAILEWKSTVPGWEDAYYWYDTDGGRYVFSPEASFQSWFPGEPTGVVETAIPELAPIPLLGAVPHKPGARMIQFESSPNVYAVGRYGVLRWITTEQVALEMYGIEWKTAIDLVSVANYPLYHFGSPITDAAEFDPAAYHNLTNPATNVVNAAHQPPEAFTGTVLLQVDTTTLIVGKPLALTAEVRKSDTSWSNLTIRIYDQADQVIGTCKATPTCRIETVAGGPLGDQRFIARVFNEYGQAFASAPVIRYVTNP